MEQRIAHYRDNLILGQCWAKSIVGELRSYSTRWWAHAGFPFPAISSAFCLERSSLVPKPVLRRRKPTTSLWHKKHLNWSRPSMDFLNWKANYPDFGVSGHYAWRKSSCEFHYELGLLDVQDMAYRARRHFTYVRSQNDQNGTLSGTLHALKLLWQFLQSRT